MNRNRRGTERLFLLLNTLVLGLLFLQLYRVHLADFEEVSGRLAEGTMVNLNDANVAEGLVTLLQKRYYFDDKKDIELISSVVARVRGSDNGTIDNIGELNKKKYYVSADEAYESGGESFKKRILASRALLGFTGSDSSRFVSEKVDPPSLSSSLDLGSGANSIRGKIINKDGAAVAGVPVRLEMVIPQDSVYSNEVSQIDRVKTEKKNGFVKSYVLGSAGNRQLQSLTAYTRTDEDGRFVFKNLPDDKGYSVLPLQPGFQFGASQGVQGLDSDESFTFRQTPHTIRLFSSRDFNILKKEKSLIVRQPRQFSFWYLIIVLGFFLGFYLLHFLLNWKFKEADPLILPLIMLLTGLSFVTLLSLQDPLRDRFLARDSLLYFGLGIFGIAVLMLFNLKRFTVDSGFYRLFYSKKDKQAANGWPWIALAISLLVLTILFGSGPEGSGVKVNLFGFQPSELVKYCIILFLAGFFAANERFISEYTNYRKRWSFFSFALAAILISILLFLILGDLGPSMVICFTFIVLFSFSRGDFMFMAATVVLYVVASWIFSNTWIATAITLSALALGIVFYRKQLSESALMALVVIAGFLLLDQVPLLDKIFPGPVQRLVERKSIWQDAWNNEVFGGDQVANGIWAMSGGGVTGQGVGEGFAKTIPEAHTDMVLPSLGEEFGWTGIICVFILFLIYLHRAILIGRQTGTPFLFYLCAGIGISTFIQFLLIAGGSTGALPLSGVSLPFISYGGSSLVANMLAAGFLLSASMARGSDIQLSYISRQQDRNLIPALAAACLGVLMLSINVSRYLFNNKKWVVQPALVADRSGSRMFSYNPRIAILMNKLQAGSLFDRNGLILATSKPELVKQQFGSIMATGINYKLDSAMHKRPDRYYPFAEHMFFWTGDANTGVFSGSINGYFAEYEHAAELRGFEAPVSAYDVKASRFREDRFLPRGVKEMTVNKRDFSAIAPLLIAGINSRKVEEFKQRNRDVQLSMDAALQTGLQKAIAADDSLKDNRVSVVVMESNSGDVLASAVYPLPPVNNWERLTMSYKEQNSLAGWMTTQDLGFSYATQPGSTAKVATTLAAFNKLGFSAADIKYPVSAKERIRIKGPEPDETGLISMERALVKSNNVYFIKLANEQKLQDEMASVYLRTGMFLHGVGGFYFGRDQLNPAREQKWRELWRRTEFNTKPAYDPNNIRKSRAKGISGMAWGQGELIATPASIGRLASGIANNGLMVNNRFVLRVSDSLMAVKEGVRIANDPQYAALIKSYMIKQSAGKTAQFGLAVAGKTGTPERVWKKARVNDGWFVFFAPKSKDKGYVVVCIRIEVTKGSSDAVALAGKHVIPLLVKKGYIKGFPSEQAIRREPLPVRAANREGSMEAVSLPSDTLGE